MTAWQGRFLARICPIQTDDLRYHVFIASCTRQLLFDLSEFGPPSEELARFLLLGRSACPTDVPPPEITYTARCFRACLTSTSSRRSEPLDADSGYFSGFLSPHTEKSNCPVGNETLTRLASVLPHSSGGVLTCVCFPLNWRFNGFRTLKYPYGIRRRALSGDDLYRPTRPRLPAARNPTLITANIQSLRYNLRRRRTSPPITSDLALFCPGTFCQHLTFLMVMNVGQAASDAGIAGSSGPTSSRRISRLKISTTARDHDRSVAIEPKNRRKNLSMVCPICD